MKKDHRVNLKVDPELHRKIKVAAAEAGVEMYAIVERAWQAYENMATGVVELTPEATLSSYIASSGTRPGSPVLESPKDSSTIGESYLKTSPGEHPWVIRFLRILRSGSVASRGIKWNIVMVLKGMGLPYDTENFDIPEPQPGSDRDSAARAEIEAIEELVGMQEPPERPHEETERPHGAPERPHTPHRKGHRSA